jgi:hypothetical protein
MGVSGEWWKSGGREIPATSWAPAAGAARIWVVLATRARRASWNCMIDRGS